MYKTYFQFTFTTTSLLIGLNLINIRSAQAIINTYNFQVSVDSGSLSGNTYSGSLSFDDSGLTGSGDEYLSVPNIEYNFSGTNYTENDALVPPEVLFSNGNFLGLDYSTNAQFSFISGFDSVNDALFSYDVPGATGSGLGSIDYSVAPTPVPFEVNSTAGILLLGGLFIGKKAFRRCKGTSK